MAIRIDGTNTAANPGITGADADTGLQFGTDEVSIVTGGTTRATVDSSGNVGIGTTSPGTIASSSASQLVIANTADASARGGLSIINGTNGFSSIYMGDTDATARGYIEYSHGLDALTFGSAGSERARIDSSGRLLVGTSSSAGGYYGTVSHDHLLQVSTSGAGAQGYTAQSWTANPGTGPTSGVHVAFARSRGTTTGSTTSVAGNDKLAVLSFQGADGSKFTEAARIEAHVDGTPGVSDMPGRLVFSTTADGASSPTEKVRIDNAGRFTIANLYNNTSATGRTVLVQSSGELVASTSSIKYKTDVETLQDSYADAVLQVRPVWYKSLCTTDNPSWGWWGFIAEEVAEVDPRLVQWKTSEISHDENGVLVVTELDTPEPEGVYYDRFVPHLLNLIKRQKEQIESQSTAIAALETRLTALEGGSN